MGKIGLVTPDLTAMSISGYDVPFSQSFKKLGFCNTLHGFMYLNTLFSHSLLPVVLCWKKFALHSTDAASKLVSLILSWLDYCYSLLAVCRDNRYLNFCLQNHAAQLVLCKPGMWVQNYCSEHSVGFKWQLGSNTKLLAPSSSVSVTRICFLSFPIFYMYSYHPFAV